MTFIGLLVRAFAEWLVKEPKSTEQIESEELAQKELEEAIEYLRLKMIEQDAEIEERLEELEDEDEEDNKRIIH